MDVLEHGSKELMQRASSLFPCGKPLKSVTVEFGFVCVDYCNELVFFLGVKIQLFVGLRAFRVAVFLITTRRLWGVLWTAGGLQECK